ncbi:hypothetical protein Tco_0167299 [Tanacetum coccineum]
MLLQKLPLLKQGEYEMWRLRIVQYFQIQDYALWDVIENGNSFKPTARTTSNADGTSTLMIPGPITTEEKAQKKNDVKARSMLLMALPNEHQLTFNQYKDDKTFFAAIQIRFGGNDATKKTQKTLLNQLAILGENISQEDLNLKFLRSLPSEWNTHVVVWRNKPDFETISFDDLYNNFKIIEQEVKRIGTSSSNSSSQNMAFVSTPGSINEANTVNVQVSTANSSVSTDSTLDSTANLSDATIYAFLANQPNGSQLIHEDLEQIYEDDLEEIDLKWQLALLRHFARECRGPRNQESRPTNQDISRRNVNVEDTSSKAMVAINGAGLIRALWQKRNFKAHKTQLDNLRVEFNKSEFNLATYKRGLTYVEEQLVFYKKNEVMFCDQVVVLKRDALFKDSEIIALKSEIEKLKKEKELEKMWGIMLFHLHLQVYLHPPTIDLSNSGLKEFQQHEFKGYGPKANKSVCIDTSNEVKKTPDTPLVEEFMSEKGKQNVFPTKIEFVKQQDKTTRKPVKHVKRGRDTKMPQSSSPLVKVGDEVVHKELDDRMERATTTASSFEAEQDSDAQTRFETISKSSNDPPLSRVNTLGSGEDSMKLMELMDAEIPQSQFPTQTQVADEVAFTSVDVNAGGAATTDIGLEVGQGSGTMHKTPTRPYDSPLLRVHILGSDEGSLQQNELMDLVTKLTDRVEVLENDLQQTKKVYSSALTNIIIRVKKLERKVKTRQPRRRARVIISDTEEDLEDPSKQGRKIGKTSADTEILLDLEELTELVEDLGSSEKGEKEISTANISVSTASATPKVSTAAANLVYIRRSAEKRKDKGKAIMKEDESVQKKEKKKLEDAEIANQLQGEFDIARQEQEVVAEADQAHNIDWSDTAVLRYHELLNRSFFVTEVRKNTYQNNALLPKDSEIEKEVMKRPGFDFQQKSSKKRSREDSDEDNAKKLKLEDDAEKEELRDSMDVVPRDDIAIDIESLATKYLIVDWKTHVLTENMMYYQIISADRRIAIHMMIEKKYPLTQEMFSRMLSRRLEVNQESEMAFELLRFIRSQLQKSKNVWKNHLRKV